MKKIRRFVALLLTLSIALICSVSAYASGTSGLSASDSTELRDFLVSGMVAAEAVSEFEKETNIKFDIADYSNLDFSGEKRDDTESFLIDYLSSSGSTISNLSKSEEVSLAEAKATSVAYAIECAQWSISQNRATDIVSEAEYMFISHYVDRKDYFWNQGDPSLLLDGEARSEAENVLAKWITNYDRQAYNTYMDSTKVSSALQRVGNIALGATSLKADYDDLSQAVGDVTLAGRAFSVAKINLLELDSALTTVDVLSDARWLITQITADFSSDPTESLDVLFQRYMEDGNILTSYGSVDKKALIQNSIALVGGYAMGGCSGAANSALGILKSAVIGFTIEAYTDFFNYVAWLALQYGYSGRYAMRLSDYLGI